LPVPLSEAPTDADYAIEVIAQRIAKGEEIKHPRSRKHRSSSARGSEVDLLATSSSPRSQWQTQDGVDWKKWGARVAQGKSLIGEGKQLLSQGQVRTLFIQSLDKLIVIYHDRLAFPRLYKTKILIVRL
jgi:GRAM domain-containing protein 4